MSTNYSEYLCRPIFRGEIVDAEYKEQLIYDYRDNPFIEALPNILSPKESLSKLRYLPDYNNDERYLPAHLRIHCVERISDLIIPLNKHIEAEQFISRAIRHGYKSRNPLSIEYTRLLNAGSAAIKAKDISVVKTIGQFRSTACGQVTLGMSGIGKSTVFESVLMHYPQVITHTRYKDKILYVKQVVWLKLECPFDGGINGLCLKFFKAMDSLLGTTYYKKFGKGKSSEHMLPEMSQVATLHGLGVLVIDEIQNLDQAKSGGEKKMLNFFVELINTFSLPIILIGTYKASFLFDSVFRDSRRVSGQIDPIWRNLSNDREWERFIKTLWEYQWTRNTNPLTQKIVDVLYDESQGIVDIAVKLFKLAQWRAITTGREIIDSNIIHSVSIDYLKLIKPMLDAIKSRIDKNIRKYEDIHIPSELMASAKMSSIVCLSGEETVTVKENKNNNKKPEKIVLISDICSWLIQAGISQDKSALYATKVVDTHNKTNDIATLRREAFLLANMDMFANSSNASQEHRVSDVYKNHDDETLPQEKLPDMLEKAKSDGKSISQVLEEKNLLKTPSELLPR